MAFIRFTNPCEYSFLIWITQHPESFHPLDMERFYAFVKNVARYRSRKWHRYDYFESRVLAVKGNFDIDNVDKFHSKLLEMINFHKTPPNLNMNPYDFDKRKGYFQRGVKDGKMYEVAVSKEEFYGKGANSESMKNADFI